MPKAAIIAGSLVDVRNVGTHKSVKLTVHVPAELAQSVFAAFGWPTGVAPVEVAIARLNTELPRRETIEATPRPASIGQATPAGDDKPRKSPAQIAGYLCTTPLFRAFLSEKFSVRKVETADRAAQIVRELCKVDSRSQITADNTEWHALMLAFKLWEREAQVVPA